MSDQGRPINLYWWKDSPNFGDGLSAGIVAHVARREVTWARDTNCELFAIGSILHRAENISERPTRTMVWGRGDMKFISSEATQKLQFLAVRGPLTASYLDLDKIALGDPGIFANESIENDFPKTHKVGVVPHLYHRAYRSDGRLAGIDGVIRIDPKTSDYMSVIGKIASCEYILSSSLHGLIIADALSIPNTWIDPFGINRMAKIKYYDYALSVGRVFRDPVALERVTALCRRCAIRSQRVRGQRHALANRA